ncbi:MAG: phosphoribosylformylglycinamidine synthase subunit PurQ [Thermodesulfobacteriota bacteirum]|nr:phosphoribosylformylglycinamidine synthase subunit PurQ [Thermodesulfobacteriota bacterium]
MNFGVIQFPGSNCEQDCFYVVKHILKQNCSYIWHDSKSLKNIDCIIVPGGFSYGDYLRTGAIAAQSNISSKIKDFANNGGVVIGICNGFQILTELKLLPGVLLRNKSLNFICKDVNLKVANSDSIFTSEYYENEMLKIPIAHAEGNFYLNKSEIVEVKKFNQIIFQYTSSEGLIDKDSNPNGSILNIAGIRNKKGNVLGLMPHPERVSEKLLGGLDGKKIFQSIIKHLS